MSSRLYESRIRFVEAGRFASERPGRHSFAGRSGRGVKPPPQFGQTLQSLRSAQSAQNVHSYVQMRASVEAAGKSMSQYSQLGRSSRAMRTCLSHGRYTVRQSRRGVNDNQPSNSAKNRIVEIVAFPDVRLLDVTGPLQVLACANMQPSYICPTDPVNVVTRSGGKKFRETT
jgi:hypothetical protein